MVVFSVLPKHPHDHICHDGKHPITFNKNQLKAYFTSSVQLLFLFFFCLDHYFCALREAVKEQRQPLVTLRAQDAESVKTTSCQRKQQQTAHSCVLHNGRVLETALSLQLFLSFGGKPDKGQPQVSRTKVSLSPYCQSAAAFNQFPANKHVVCLQAGNFLHSERLFFCGRSHTFHHTISAYWHKVQCRKKKKRNHLAVSLNFLFSVFSHGALKKNSFICYLKETLTIQNHPVALLSYYVCFYIV